MSRIWQDDIIAALVVLAVAFGLYVNSIHPSFHWDDERLVYSNIHIRTLRNIPLFFLPGYINVYEAGSGQRYRPFRSLSFSIDYFFWKDNALGYHLTNVILHVAASMLLWKVMKIFTQDNFISFWSAVLFAAHPVHTESVAYVKNRSDIICAIFYLLAMILFLKYLHTGKLWFYAGSMISTAIALVSKEMAVVLPFILLGIALVEKKQEGIKSIAKLSLPYLILLIGYLMFRKWFLGGTSFPFPLSFRHHLVFIANTIGEYFKVLIFPYKLSLDRVMPLNQPLALWSLFSIGCVCGFLLYTFVKRKYIFAFWLSFLVLTILPVSNVFFLLGRPFAEQRMYIPSMAVAALLPLAIKDNLNEKYKWQSVLLLGVVFVLFSYKTIVRNLDWKDEVILWQKTVAGEPKSYRAWHNLGVAQFRRGNYAEAIENVKKSIEIAPDFVEGYNTLGGIYHKIGLYKESIIAYENGLKLSKAPEPVILTNLATLYGIVGERVKAEELFRRVIRSFPWFDSAYYNLGLLLYNAGRKDEALWYFKETLALNPYNEDAKKFLRNYGK